jgi:hypothetical protein
LPFSTSPFFRALRLSASLGLAAGLAQSCSDDTHVDSPPSPDAGADSSTGGQAGSQGTTDASAGSPGTGGGGAAPTGGAGGSGGGAGHTGWPGETLQVCLGTTLLDVDALNFPPCSQCDDAVCVPNALLGSVEGAAGLLAPCDAENTCVPKSYVATLGNFHMGHCTAFGSAEGRCVNKCVPQIRNQVGLEQDVCGDNELCAPCYMPTDGAATGACGLGCDPGPSEEPYLFDACCGGGGVCVPSTLVPENQRSALDVDACTEPDTLCVPTAFISPGFIPDTCESVGGTEGRCIPECIGMVAASASFLPQSTCNDNELCAPCYDPRTGQETGACRIGNDAPVEDPYVFSDCCDDLGLCVPESAVPPAQRGALNPDSCTGQGELCAPKAFIDPTFQAVKCTSLLDAEGRCIPACTVGSFAQYLSQDVCPNDGEVCAPCYDPISGNPTGACSINGDAPTEPAVVFQDCCGDTGICVPEDLVPDGQRFFLSGDTCPGDAAEVFLCAPRVVVQGTLLAPDCTFNAQFGIPDGPGVCYDPCTVPIFSGVEQSTCDPGKVCLPCLDDNGQSTGICAL